MKKINEVEVSYEYLDKRHSGVNINHFYVPPHRRREGLGSQVLQKLVSKFENENFNYVVVNMKGGDKAESFLKSNGFEIVDRYQNSVTGEINI